VFAHDITVRDCRFDGVAEGNNIKGLTQNVRLQNLFINGTLMRFPIGTYSSEKSLHWQPFRAIQLTVPIRRASE